MGFALNSVARRVYADYLMPSRLDEYQRLIDTALSNRYTHTSVIGFYDALRDDRVSRGEKFFVRRHDVDTDTGTARAMFAIEQRMNVASSFYFRLSTLDVPLMKEMNAYGSEASYHYEEIAQVAKEKKIKTAADVDKHMPEIRKRFEDNFTRLSNSLQYRMRSVASHGDFVNRRLDVPNHRLMSDVLKTKLAIDVEAYDPVLLNAYNVIISDTLPPEHYKPTNPFDILKEGKAQVVYLLTHPRHWRTNAAANTKDNVKRFYEGLIYGLG